MPQIKSSIRSVKTDALRKSHNFQIKSTLRTSTRKVVEAIEAGEQPAAQELFVNLVGAVDKAARKGIIHKNAAARKKSRLAKRLNKVNA